MTYVDLQGYTCVRGVAGATAPTIYVVGAVEHPLGMGNAAAGLSSNVVVVPVRAWNESLTPWPAEALYRGEADFGGRASNTLDELVDEAIPAIEETQGLRPSSRAICGYSLGGLFSLYALVQSEAFAACACLSGSVWYEGWVSYLRELQPQLAGRFAYLSVGTKEKRAARPLLKGVQRNMEECAQILRDCGCQVDYRTGPGNHLQHVEERFQAGLAALDGFVA